MLKFICLFIILTISTNCNSQRNCEQFKVGKFRIVEESIKHKSTIERTDSFQIEIDSTTGQKSVFNINWLNDCEYTLTVNRASQSISDFFEGHVFKVVITDTNDTGYLFESYLDDKLISSNYMVKI